MRYKPPTTRERGLEKVMGAELYKLFVAEYNHQMNVYGKIKPALFVQATGLSRSTIYKYLEVYNEELSNDKPTDT